ncbi:hypothetical protein BGZ76_004246 [Entomortierella beljakovae]|nr:hypothetical protein BGZ76_004246 [Entomortierella beljakovae]
MMVQQYQQFQLGDTTEKVCVTNVTTTNGNSCFVSFEDIQEVFHNAQRFKLNGNPIPFLKDSNGNRILPLRIAFYPDKILEVVTDITYSTNTRMVARTHRKLETQSSKDLLLSSSNLIQSFNSALATRNQATVDAIRCDLTQNLGTLEKRVGKEKVVNNEVQKQTVNLLIEAKERDDQAKERDNLAKERDSVAKEMDRLAKEMDNLAKERDNLVKERDNLAKELDNLVKGRDNQMMLMQEQITPLQNQALDRLVILQRHAEAILIQNFELHEYPIPRLFIILPVDQSNWNPLRILENKFRLHFLCECGDHTVETCKSGHNQIHIAKHEGYDIRNATEFYRKFGKYILILLQALKIGVQIANKSVPTIHAPKVLDPRIDLSITYMNALSIETPTLENINTIDDFESLEGANLRQLDKFLQINDENRKLGNLYRITLDTGHVKWVCIDHYRSTYNEEEQKALESVVEMNGGRYDSELGKVMIKLESIEGFFDVLGKGKHIYDLDITFDWDYTKTDLELFRTALTTSRVSILRLDIRHQNSITSELLTTSSLYEALIGITELPNARVIHIVLPYNLVNLSSLQSKRSSHLFKLSYEMASQLMGTVMFQAFINTLKTNNTLTSLNLDHSTLGNGGALALSEALKTNTTLTTLDLRNNSIGNEGALALSEALKINATLTTLNLRSNSIESEGALAFSEALKTNTTLTSLSLWSNPIRNEGTLALSEALKTNTALTTLNLCHNLIKTEGALALSEALKTNTTLIALDLNGNSIGSEGALALSVALMTNTTLTTLELGRNTIEDEGALALSEALKINTTLSTLSLWNNSIRNEGALALSEALKTNTTLTTLDLSDNWIGREEVLALSEALKTNTTLTTLELGYNVIEDEEVLALSEVLNTNTTLSTLNLQNNSIGKKGALALSEALKTNATLINLNLSYNSIRDEGALVLSEAFKTNATLITLNLEGNSIGTKGALALTKLSTINTKLSISLH